VQFARLSIRDISGGDQPYFSQENSHIAAINGELYNEDFVKNRLKSHRNIIPSGDMQLLAEFLIQDIDNLRYIEGMFAGFIYNKFKKEIVLQLVSMNGFNIINVSDNLQLDKEVVYTAIKKTPMAYHYIDKSFFNDKEFILLCLNSNGYDEENYEKFLKILSNEFKDDKDIVIACIKKCCKNIIYCSKRLRNDKEIVLTAINNSYYDFYEKMTENDTSILIDFKKQFISFLDEI
jgi:hypothetical protein